MKNLFYILTVIAFSGISLFAQSETLHGNAAIENLKQNGQYDSLARAVRAARKENEQTDKPQIEDAVGQTAKLTASDGLLNDEFGRSVAVSGDTAIVAATGDDNGRGSAYVFIRSGTTWIFQQKLTASDGTGTDFFGTSVAISGDTAIIGAPSDDLVVTNDARGSAYIFVRSGTVWTQQQKLTAADGANSDQFGISVSIDGNTAIIGTNRDDVGANTDQGSAYVFVRSGTMWAEQQKLTAPDGATNDQFGRSVSIDGDSVIVGAHLDDAPFNDALFGTQSRGSAYIFVRSGTIWSLQQKIMPGAIGDQFGFSVSIEGNTAIIGAWNDTVGGNISQGSAYIFVRTGTVWSLQQSLTAADGADSDRFGFSVSIDGDKAVIGAFFHTVGANSAQGAAYVFIRTGDIWTQQQKLTAADGAANDQFGIEVAISGANIVIGANFDDIGANANQGSAYIFRNLFNNWTQESQKVASDGAADDNFGKSVAISGDTAVVGAWLDDGIAGIDQGSAYIFVRSGNTWTQQQKITAADGAANDYFGISIAIYGDTIVVGAYLDDVGANADQGSAYVFTRNGTIWTQQAKLNGTGGAANDQFAVSVAVSGNTAIVGAFQADVGTNNEQGSAYVFTRSGTTWTQQAQLNATDGTIGDRFGISAAISGNTVVIGGFADDVGANADQGSAYVFTRNGTTWTQQAQLNASDGAAEDQFGNSVGISEETVIVGASLADGGANTNQGAAYIFTRSGMVWTQQQKLTAADGTADDIFGSSVSISGDAAIVGAYLDDVGANADQGSAYIFIRSHTVWMQQQQLTASGGTANDQFGLSVAISGDKIIVGVPNSDASVSNPFVPNADNQGAIFVFANNLLPTAASVTVSGRVFTSSGTGLRNAFVSMTDFQGNVRTMRTSTFGYFRFDEVEVGQTYVFSVNSKQYRFVPQAISISEDISELNFTAEF